MPHHDNYLPAKALLVDDHAHARAWLREALESAFPAITIVEAERCATGRAQLRAGLFQLALVDIGLPDECGLSLVEELVRCQPDCRVVVATVFDDDEHLFAALRAGAHGYLLKDQPAPLLAQLLRGISAGQPPLSPAMARRLIAHFHAPPAAPAAELTAREREVLTLIAKGLTIAAAAETLGISRHTAAGYAKDIYRKLKVGSRAEAALEATRRGLVVP